jgi:hypothetical protein
MIPLAHLPILTLVYPIGSPMIMMKVLCCLRAVVVGYQIGSPGMIAGQAIPLPHKPRVVAAVSPIGLLGMIAAQEMTPPHQQTAAGDYPIG